LCIINGDELVFNREFLAQGYQGGRTAAQQLTQAIAGQLSSEEVHVYGRLSFWITIYFNKSELSEDLSTHNICTQEQFQAFLAVGASSYPNDLSLTYHWQGFTQASPRFSTIDVGLSKDALEAKIKGKYMTDISGFAEHLAQNISKFSPLFLRHCGCSLEVGLTKILG